MDGQTEVRPADVSRLINNIGDDSSENDNCGVSFKLQSDRGIWQLTLWFIFMMTALCSNWQVFTPSFLVAFPICSSNDSSQTNDLSSGNSSNWTLAPRNVHKVNNCFRDSVTAQCTGRNYESVSAYSSDEYIITKCIPGEYSESSNASEKVAAFHGTKYHIAASKSVYMLGSFVTAIFFQSFINRYGQRCVIFCGFLAFCLGSVATFLTSSAETFIALRFFLALGITTLYWTTLEAMLESVIPDYRLIYGVTSYLGWAVGYMLLPVIAWLTPDWFSYLLSVSIPCFLLTIPLWFLPESVNYLLHRGKVKEAADLLKEALRKNGQSTDDVTELCHQSHRTIIKNTREQKGNIWLKLKLHLGYRSLLFYTSSFMISLLYYLLSWEFYQIPGDPFVNFGWSGAMETLAMLLLIFFGYFLGPRLLLFLMATGASIFPLAATLITAGESLGPIHSYMAAKFFASGAFALTAIRGFQESSLGVVGAVMSAGAAVAPFMDEMVVKNYNTELMTSACIFCLIFGILSAFLPVKPKKYFIHSCSSDNHETQTIDS